MGCHASLISSYDLEFVDSLVNYKTIYCSTCRIIICGVLMTQYILAGNSSSRCHIHWITGWVGR